MKTQPPRNRSLWATETGDGVMVMDQTQLPHRIEVCCLQTLAQVVHAIETMQVRGAPLIGATAAYGLALALRQQADDAALETAAARLLASRPTAINLHWAVERVCRCVRNLPAAERASRAWQEAAAIAEEDVCTNLAIGRHGLPLLQQLAARKNTPLNLLTHCNAGWLATVGWGTALAPVYQAFDAGVPLHVWVDETRPRNQGASLTAWELGRYGVPHTVIADNAGGHLMQRGQVDLVLVGADRISRKGDVCNKIGTYLKALAAFDNDLPFYAVAPSSSVDWTLAEGRDIPIEERHAEEVGRITGRLANGTSATVELLPPGSRAANPAFDVTPARLVTGILTERGMARPDQLDTLFPEHRP